MRKVQVKVWPPPALYRPYPGAAGLNAVCPASGPQGKEWEISQFGKEMVCKWSRILNAKMPRPDFFDEERDVDVWIFRTFTGPLRGISPQPVTEIRAGGGRSRHAPMVAEEDLSCRPLSWPP